MMKSPFRKVRGLHKRHRRDLQRSFVQLDELSLASQDMQDMRDCYDSLLSAAASTTNNAYEFSESLQEMGDCLLEKTALTDDEDSGRVLLMLGKAQLEIQKLVDNYRSHISQTITNPSESLLNELRIVEDMKKDCDDKRKIYETTKEQYDKGRMKGSKGEHVSSRQLQVARDEFDEQATLFIFRMKSLKRGQSRSLLTQAARHYAAQMSFFRKALKSLETIEPHVKLTTEQQHIDYLFSGLEDDDRDSISLTDDEDDEDDSDAYSDTPKEGELNNESHTNVTKNEVSTSGNPMELEDEDVTFPSVAPVNAAEVNIYGKPIWNSVTFDKTGSKSAPIMLESTLDPHERYRQMRQSSTRRLNTYVLPTPLENSSVTSKIETQQPQPKPKPPTNMWHSLPFEKVSEPSVSSKPTPLPAPQVVVRSPLQIDPRSTSSAKKIKRYAFSGPLAGDAQSKQPLYASGPIGSTVRHPPVSRSVSRTTLTQPLSLSASVSVPKISELHELPRPPPKMASKKSTKVGFSAPLVTFKHGPDVDTNKLPVSDAAYTLPVPSGSQRDATVAKQTQTWDLRTDKSMVSPPLSPITLKSN
ncbi:arfaptin homology (AH) domain/BAR domain protein [Artemisia annua]|uniref:Arfaptin homology (AH) domain/BAR domain protein n=1 Tax=Artemisia annua TaxID=35608 RepID=A0A2U1MQ95_ARTAN|nr:arfaptin homology (AH) domain/BAR domain protein [Artemisia annua]